MRAPAAEALLQSFLFIDDVKLPACGPWCCNVTLTDALCRVLNVFDDPKCVVCKAQFHEMSQVKVLCEA